MLAVENSSFIRLGAGISARGSGSLYVTGSVFRDGSFGMNVRASERQLDVLVDDTHFDNNSGNSISAHTDGAGSILKLVVRDARINRSANIGIIVTADIGGSAQADLEGCLISNGNTGLTARRAIVRVSNSTIINNRRAFATGSETILTRRNNTVEAYEDNGVFGGTYSAR